MFVNYCKIIQNCRTFIFMNFVGILCTMVHNIIYILSCTRNRCFCQENIMHTNMNDSAVYRNSINRTIFKRDGLNGIIILNGQIQLH